MVELPHETMPFTRPIALAPLPERPLVSVVMTNYNYAQYVGEAIESVLAQGYDHFEITSLMTAQRTTRAMSSNATSARIRASDCCESPTAVWPRHGTSLPHM